MSAARATSSRQRTHEARPLRPSWDRSDTRATSTCRPSSPNPEEAGRFVAETGVDALAVAIGTVHGMTETGAVLDVERIADLARHVDAALVMHGSSGVDDETLARAVAAGIRKVNLSTALQRVFMDTLRQSAVAPGHETDARAVLGDARDAVMEAARHRIRLLGATGRA